MLDDKNLKDKIIDPPEGWKYGFPKKCTEDCDDLNKWLTDNGYPEELLKRFGNYCPVRIIY
jgi:hypothetical protein